MTTGLVWIIGGGGQLGRELMRRAKLSGETIFSARLPWLQPALPDAIGGATTAFAELARTHARWAVCWAAGAGVVGTAQATLAAETEALLAIVGGLAAAKIDWGSGALVLASSAGGVYGDTEARPIDEGTPPSPISDYGRNKLQQEECLAALAQTHGVPLLIARISNLYGPGQDLRKPQGFISQILRNQLLGTALNVFVPLDTQRDFLFAPDCAAHMLSCIDRLQRERPTAPIVKILAHGQSATLREVIALAQRLTKKKLRVVTQPQSIGKLQPRSHRYRSSVWPESTMPQRTALPVGLRLVYEAQLQAYMAGRLR